MGYTPEELQTLEDMNKVSQGLTPDATIPTNQAFIAENTETAKTPSLNTPVTNIASQAVPQAGAANALNTSALNQTVQQGTQAQQLTGLSQYANKDYVAPEYTNQDFFPGIGQPIVVGNVSSKTLGSSALIAPTGQYVPYNIIAKRERALDEARKAREERKAKYKDPTAPSMESPKYNKNLQEAYYQELEAAKAKAKAKYGEYWIDAAQDQGNETYTEFQKINNTYNWLAKEGDALTKNAAAVIEAVEKGDDTSYSKGEVEAAYAIQNGSFGGAKPEELVAQGKILKGYRNIETNLKESQFFKDVLPTITAKVIDGNGYVTQQESKNWSEQIQKEAEYLKKTKYNYLDEVTVDMIKEAMEARLPKYQIKKDITMKPNQTTATTKAQEKEESKKYRLRNLQDVVFDYVGEDGKPTDEAMAILGRIPFTNKETGAQEQASYQMKGSFNAYKELQKNLQSLQKNVVNDLVDYEGLVDRTEFQNEINKIATTFNEANPGMQISPSDISLSEDKTKLKIGGAEVDPTNAEAVENALISAFVSSDAVKYKNDDVIVLTSQDPLTKLPKKQYLRTKDPETVAIVNKMLNVMEKEAIDLDPVLEEAKGQELLYYGNGKKAPAKTETKITFQEAMKDKDVLAAYNQLLTKTNPATKKKYTASEASSKIKSGLIASGQIKQ